MADGLHGETMKEIQIQGAKIGDSQPTYFVAEAGLNHNGDLNIAKHLIDEAFNCGADAIKFQTYKTSEFLTKNSEYLDFFENVELSYEEFKELNDYSKNIGITFFSAPFDINSAEFLIKLGVPCFKIASSDLTNHPLIQRVAKTKTPLIISTGLSTMKEVENAVNTCMNEGNNKIILLHCIANYPTLPNEVNLSSMKTIKKKFNLPVGFSDNGDSNLVDLVAVSMGANIIEKHFTLDKNFEGPDHSFSIEPKNLKMLIQQIRQIELMKGDGIKVPQKSEKENINAIRKSIYANKEISKGESLGEENISIKRPAISIQPEFYNEIVGRKVNKNIKIDEPINWQDLA
jgi:sialic acid synthase SpsE